jgi:hypothetical protein
VLRVMRALLNFFFVGVPLEEFLQVWMSFWDCVKQVLLTFMVAWLYLNYLFFMLITYMLIPNFTMFFLLRLPMLLPFRTKYFLLTGKKILEMLRRSTPWAKTHT